jgi:hypothetical protein
VTTWVDNSGNGHNFSQTNSLRRATVVDSQLNGLPVLDFDGSDLFEITNTNILSGDPGSSVFVVVKDDGLNNSVYYRLSNGLKCWLRKIPNKRKRRSFRRWYSPGMTVIRLVCFHLECLYLLRNGTLYLQW